MRPPRYLSIIETTVIFIDQINNYNYNILDNEPISSIILPLSTYSTWGALKNYSAE